MFCEHCGAQVLDNSRFCGNCGHPAPAGPAGYGRLYCDTLEVRLRQAGFETRRDVPMPPYQPGLVAQKRGMNTFIEVFGRFTVFIAAMPMDNPDPTSVLQFSERVAGFAKECGATSHLFMTMAFPVVVARTIDAGVRTWLTESKMGPRYNMILFPVIVVQSTRETVYCTRTGFVAAAQYPKLREFAARWFPS